MLFDLSIVLCLTRYLFKSFASHDFHLLPFLKQTTYPIPHIISSFTAHHSLHHRQITHLYHLWPKFISLTSTRLQANPSLGRNLAHTKTSLQGEKMKSLANMTHEFLTQCQWEQFHHGEDELELPTKHQVSRHRQDHPDNPKTNLAYCSTKARSKVLRKLRQNKRADRSGGLFGH